jgi:[acyl-carrier-protein] S-malonyltransferase
MMAVLFVPLPTVQSLLPEIDEGNRLVLANDNAPDQVVISGDVQLLKRMEAAVIRGKLGKCRMVEVVGPWHSPFMKEAEMVFKNWVETVEFSSPKLPIIFNATASAEQTPQTIKTLITEQLTRPVYWRSCMDAIKRMGVDTLFEIGPQRILSGLARLNGFRSGTAIHSISNLHAIDQANGLSFIPKK